MLLGTSAAAYAVSLAAISGLQADADAAVVASRRPAQEMVADDRAANDALALRIRAADKLTRSLAAAYDRAGSTLERTTSALDELAALVADIEGGVAALPAHIRLPTVNLTSVPPGGTSRPPRTSGRSGASGG
jgi:hypothetical protein